MAETAGYMPRPVRERVNPKELKEAVPAARLVEDLTGCPPRRSGTSLLWRCPNPSHEDRNPSFSVNSRRDIWRCWSQCDRGGSGAIDLAMWLWSLPFEEAVDRLASQYGILARPVHDSGWRPKRQTRRRRAPAGAEPQTDSRPKRRRERYNDAPRPAPTQATEMLDLYRQRRGWDGATVTAAGLEIVIRRMEIEVDDVRHWVARPYIRHPHRRHPTAVPEYWQDRSVAHDPPPTPEGRSTRWLFPKAPLVIPFGIHTDTGTEPLCLLEGPTDAITWMGYYPWVPTIALPGSGLIARWLDALAADTRPVVCITDNDDTGRKIRHKVLDYLGAQRVRVGIVPAGADPDKPWDLNDWHVAERHRPEHGRRLGSHPFQGVDYLNSLSASGR